MLMAGTAGHTARPPVGDAQAYYVRGRAAEGAGDAATAAASLSRALAIVPGSTVMAERALRQAINAGDWKLARNAALRTGAGASLDGMLWAISDAVKRGDWRAADAAIMRIETMPGFAILVRPMRAWIVFGTRSGDPLTSLGTAVDRASEAYADEHRALLMLAGKRGEGADVIASLAQGGTGRALRLKLAGAARLQKLGRRDAALALVAGPDDALVAARALLAAKRQIPGAVQTPADGIAELFARFAVDLQRERVAPLALTMSRLSTYLAPANSETWLVTAELLAAGEAYQPALFALSQVAKGDAFEAAARRSRLQLLVRSGRTAAALAEAQAAVERGAPTIPELVAYGDLLAESERPAEAAAVYARAVALRQAGRAGSELWLLHLLHGGALEQAGQWREGKAALEAAYRLAPAEAQVLNYLGYAQLERRENLDAAEALIREANRLQPDNASITDSLGWALFRRGRVAESVTVLEGAVLADPRQSAIGEHLGDAYWTAGRRIDARHAWDRALLIADAKEAARLRVKLDTGWAPAVAAP